MRDDLHKYTVCIAINNLIFVSEVRSHDSRIALIYLCSPFLIAVDNVNSLKTVSVTQTKERSRTFSRVSRPLWTMLSAISTAGILPEKVAAV